MRVLLRLTSDPPASGSPDRPLDFHRRLPGYRETPLVEAPRLAEKFGVAKVYVKDETSRFGLPSFKVLGASWATYAALRERLGPIPDGPLTYESLQSWAAPARPLTLLAATDGNHGRAVARVARWLGLKARIFLPTFVAAGRRQAIQAEGAELAVIEGVYDASVDAAVEASREPGTLLISDTARSTTDAIPQLVTAGYTTAFAEIEQQLSQSADGRIDVVAVQAGVGGLATAGTSWARLTRRGRSPRVVVVEPEPAACVMAALAAGEPVAVSASRDLGDERPAMRNDIADRIRDLERRSELLPCHRGFLGENRNGRITLLRRSHRLQRRGRGGRAARRIDRAVCRTTAAASRHLGRCKTAGGGDRIGGRFGTCAASRNVDRVIRSIVFPPG